MKQDERITVIKEICVDLVNNLFIYYTIKT